MPFLKRKLRLVLTLFAFVSCNSSQTNIPMVQQPAPPSKYSHLLSLYKQLLFDTLKVFSVAEPDSIGYIFKGRELERADVALLPKEIVVGVNNDYKSYACFQFDIGGPLVGLVTRTPAEYNSNSIKLIILDTAKDTITNFFELSSAWGDGGDYIEKQSWLVGSGHLVKTFMWYMQGHVSDEEKDTTVGEKNDYYLLALNNGKQDTIARNTQDIISVCKHLQAK